MVPLRPHRVERDYEAGAVYALVPYDERSRESHNHYFACVAAAWATLPEDIAPKFPTADYLRKWALVQARYCKIKTFVGANERDALMVERLFDGDDALTSGDVFVTRHGTIVHVMRPFSQSQKAMGRERFEQSKRDVLDVIAGLIGVHPDQLAREAEHVV
jgi:hypothetical protein